MILGAAAAADASAEQLRYAPEPAWVRPIVAPLGKLDDHPPPLQILLVDGQTQYTNKGRDSYAHAVVQIGSAAGLAAGGALSQTWDPKTQTLTVNHLHILRDGRTIDALAGGRHFTVLRREPMLEAATLDGRLTATFQPEGLQVGDAIDMAFTLHDDQPVLKGRSEGLSSLVHVGEAKRMYVRQSWPDAKAMRWRVSDDLPPPKIEHAGGWSTLIYDLSNQVTAPAPLGAPPRYQIRGLVEVSEFKDWAQVSALVAPLFETAAAVEPGSDLDAAAKRIAAQTSDPRARALAALRLTEDQIRYFAIAIGTDAYVPAPAELTWTRRYGDCKGKTAVLLALLHRLGIQAEPALAVSAAGDAVPERLPMLEDFDHVLVRAQIGPDTYWLDGTRLGDRTLDDERSNNLQWVLPLRATNGALEKIPPLEPQEALDERRITLDVSKGLNAPAQVQATRIYRGDGAVVVNMQLQSLDAGQQERTVRQMWADNYAWLQIGKVSWRFDPDQRVATLTMDGAGKPNWFTSAGRNYLNLEDTSLGWEASFRREPGPHADAPYAVSYPSFSSFHLTVLLPQHGTAITLANAGDERETVAGVAYARTVHLNGDQLVVEGSSRAVAPEFPATQAVAAQTELQRLADHDVMIDYSTAVGTALEQKKTTNNDPKAAGTASTAADDSASAWLAKGEADMADRAYAKAVDDFTQAMRKEPKSAIFVYDRGVAYSKIGDTRSALKDIQAALTIDPQDSYAMKARDKLLKLMH